MPVRPLPGQSLLFQGAGFSALLTGDMPLETEELLVAREDLPQVDLLVAGHHGSKYATSETLLAAVDPDAVAISVGYNNYGHPTPETLGRIQAQGAAVYRTDYEGHIIFTAPEGEES